MGSSFSSLFRRVGPKEKIIMVGLDAAGKTTILYKLKLGEVVTTTPTIGFNVESVEDKKASFTCWDVGGRDKIWPLLRHYFADVTSLIWVIDSNDRERIDDVREELARFLDEERLHDAKLLILANKQDLPGAMRAQEITEILKLPSVRNRHWYIQESNAINGDGLYEGLDWITSEKSAVRDCPCRYKPGCYVVAVPNLDVWKSPRRYRSSTFGYAGSLTQDTHIEILEVKDMTLGNVYGRIEEPLSGWVCLDQGCTRAAELIVALHIVPLEGSAMEVKCTNMAGEEVAKVSLDDSETVTLMNLWAQIVSRMGVQQDGIKLLSPTGRLLSALDGEMPLVQALRLPPVS